MLSKNLEQAIQGLKLPQVDWVGFREVREVTTERSARDGKPQSNETHVSQGVMAEVLVDGQFGYAATSRMDLESLRAAAATAREHALTAAPYKVHHFTQAHRPKIQKQYASPVSRALNSKSEKDLNELLILITERLKTSDKIIRTTASVQTVETEMTFVSSNGSRGVQHLTGIILGFEAIAQSGPIVQRRTNGGFRAKSYQGGWEFLETPDLWEQVTRVSQEAVELLSAEECPTEKLPLLLMPDQMMLQIHESIGHPLEIDRILGDERNYAGWSFVTAQDFGHLVYGSHLLNVTFNPSIPHELASYAFDDNGLEAKKEFLIKDGILLRGLGGIESQARSGISGVANSRACSWNRPPIDRMANLNIEPGQSSFEEMVSSVERGILMQSNRSWSIDDFRNKFQFGCEYAKLIENGKITKTLRNPNYRGVSLPFWRSLKRVGNPSTLEVFGTPNCGKGEPNQMIRVGHASPPCLFDGIEVFGGH